MPRSKPYTRPDNPGALRLTQRDRDILAAIHAFDGMLSLNQIDRLFFSGQGRSQPRTRMRSLFHHGLVTMPDEANRRRYVPMGETVYFLDQKGAALVAGLYGEEISGFEWRKKPRWSLIAHDLVVNDVRLAIGEACQTSSVTLYEWLSEGAFLQQPETAEYTDSSGRTLKRQFRPDGFFRLRRSSVAHPGKVEEFAFLLEVDMGTEDNRRFARQKVTPGVAYVQSPAYQSRFGVRYGRFAVVVHGSLNRLQNMKEATEQAGGNGLFYFALLNTLTPETVLTEPIWYLAGEAASRSLLA